ncbi:hypothetical protein [Phaeobacter sp. B1627]|uniref:hypothetical protein n=1 Tax=Phaeobacter sp. B1627 TaxID=2583809 RepID=UPI001117BC04|nr:hypothetical protein [Phaeobacter sp. B1627]TNJ48484.1 hypothetical protein FGE21_00620 [Phaeobacter sp. B1627]
MRNENKSRIVWRADKLDWTSNYKNRAKRQRKIARIIEVFVSTHKDDTDFAAYFRLESYPAEVPVRDPKPVPMQPRPEPIRPLEKEDVKIDEETLRLIMPLLPRDRDQRTRVLSSLLARAAGQDVREYWGHYLETDKKDESSDES